MMLGNISLSFHSISLSNKDSNSFIKTDFWNNLFFIHNGIANAKLLKPLGANAK